MADNTPDTEAGRPSPPSLTSHQWEIRSATAKQCRACRTLAIRRDTGEGPRWLYARSSEGFRRVEPACQPRSIPSPEEAEARIREGLTRVFETAGPGSRARVERELRLPEGYFRQAALDGELNTEALLGALVVLGIDRREFFVEALRLETRAAEEWFAAPDRSSQTSGSDLRAPA